MNILGVFYFYSRDTQLTPATMQPENAAEILLKGFDFQLRKTCGNC